MSYLPLKAAISGLTVAVVSEVARRGPGGWARRSGWPWAWVAS
jgi:hypothetical protein